MLVTAWSGTLTSKEALSLMSKSGIAVHLKGTLFPAITKSHSGLMFFGKNGLSKSIAWI